MKALDYAKLGCDTIMNMYEAPDLPPVGHFHYHAGVFLLGMYKTYELCLEEKYFGYIKSWVDSVTEPDGRIKIFLQSELDELQAGNLLFPLYEKTGERRYRETMQLLTEVLKTYPRNQEGGFWHKKSTPNQMWLDGIYMAGLFGVHYGAKNNNSAYFDEFYNQLMLMKKFMSDEKTGLLRHAWDASKTAPWADKDTGQSLEFWGRAIGWYVAACFDIADYMPDPYKSDILEVGTELIKALIPYQNRDSGLWYQVVDKGHCHDNWQELSSSSLYVYAICKAVGKGCLMPEYLQYAQKGFHGIIHKISLDESGLLQIGDVCVGTGVGDYTYYIERPVSVNDLHGAGTFVLMCSEYAKIENLIS